MIMHLLNQLLSIIDCIFVYIYTIYVNICICKYVWVYICILWVYVCVSNRSVSQWFCAWHVPNAALGVGIQKLIRIKYSHYAP